MTSRELVLTTLDGGAPKRIPRQLWTLPWAEIHFPEELKRIQIDYPDDIVFAGPALNHPLKTQGDYYSKGCYVDEWGCEFRNLEDGIIGQVKVPPIRQWEDVQNLREPEELLDVDMDQVNRFCASTDAFVIGNALPRPFERLQRLRGTEQLFIDLLTDPDEVELLLKRVHAFYMNQLAIWCDTDIDGIWFMDDWGTQQSLLISPDLWLALFYPCYQDYISLAKSKGKRTFFHSDGNTMEIIGYLADAGLDAINTQVFCMDIDELSSRYKGRITFWGEIDRQNLLPRGSIEDIRNAVEQIYCALYSDGHIVAQCEFGPGANPDNVHEVFHAWNNYPQ